MLPFLRKTAREPLPPPKIFQNLKKQTWFTIPNKYVFKRIYKYGNFRFYENVSKRIYLSYVP